MTNHVEELCYLGSIISTTLYGGKTKVHRIYMSKRTKMWHPNRNKSSKNYTQVSFTLR